MTSSDGNERIAMHVFDALGEPIGRFPERLLGGVQVLVKRPAAGPLTLMTAGVSRFPVDTGLPVELAIETIEGQEAAGFHALDIVARDIAGNRRTPPMGSPWRNREPVFTGTGIFALVATGSRYGDEFDTARADDGTPVGKVVTVRAMTYPESWVCQTRGWEALVRDVGPDAFLDVTRDDVARPTISEIANRPIVLSKLHAEHPPRWVTLEDDGMFTSVTGLEGPDYMNDSRNHETWSIGTFASRFPFVTDFVCGAAPGHVARFEDASGQFFLEDD